MAFKEHVEVEIVRCGVIIGVQLVGIILYKIGGNIGLP